MFDFGFWEIIMIMVIALIVVGPERLPGLARTAGLWLGKAKRFVTDVKAEIDQELSAEQMKKVLNTLDPGQAEQNLKNTLKEQAAFEDVYDILEETKQVGEELKQTFNETESQTTNDTEVAGLPADEHRDKPDDKA